MIFAILKKLILNNDRVTLNALKEKAEDGTITAGEFWLYIDMLTAAQAIQAEEKRLARA